MNHDMVIVTGETRSGTSLTMGLLDRMGVPIYCDDDKRRMSYEMDGTGVPDRLPMCVIRKAHAAGSAVKLLALPARKRLADFRPGVVFCMRDPRQQAMSQEKFMLALLGIRFPGGGMIDFLARRNQTAPAEFERAIGRPILVLRFEEMIAQPEQTCRTLAEFIGVHPGEAWKYVRNRSSECAPDLSIEIEAMRHAEAHRA